MTTASDEHPVGVIATAVAPITAALAAIGELRILMPTADVMISYTCHGCIVRVADRRAHYWDVVEKAFATAFVAAGWGVVRRSSGGLALEHPSFLTRLSE